MLSSSNALLGNLKRMEKNVYVPKALDISISQIDEQAKRKWTVSAKEGLGQEGENKILAEGVNAKFYDLEGKLKLQVDSEKGQMDRASSRVELTERPIATLADGTTKLIADEFLIVKKDPILATGNVELRFSEDQSQFIKAKKAIIAQSMESIDLTGVSESKVSDNMYLSGDLMLVRQINGKPASIVVDGHVVVKAKDSTCSSGHLVVSLDAAGKPVQATFTGSPVANQAGKQIRAQTIIYTVATGSFRASGGVSTNAF